MTQVDRYLETVGMFLPERQKNDILSELSDNIRSRIEDREAELGRQLTDIELQDILKDYGHPMSVAGRYQPETGGLMFGKQLIGPALFSIYVRVLGISLLVALAVQVVLTIALELPTDGVFARLMVHVFMQSAAVTLVFVLIQRMAQEHPDQWGWLTGHADVVTRTASLPKISRLESGLQIVLLAIFIAITYQFLSVPDAGIGPFKLAPIWYALYVPFILSMVAGIVQSAINLARPNWVRFHAAAQVGFELFSLTMIGILLAAGVWVTLAVPAEATVAAEQKLVEIVAYMNQTFFYGLLISVAISLYQLVQNVRRYRRLSR
ncbi:MAG: hypothetical protein JNL73_16450 [Anaerolineales bacterium]|nr:hypothetical protein [Anaerolineales bacterium]